LFWKQIQRSYLEKRKNSSLCCLKRKKKSQNCN
jgi:hypothetical protein